MLLLPYIEQSDIWYEVDKGCIKNVRENLSGNKEWTVQRHRQHWEQIT